MGGGRANKRKGEEQERKREGRKKRGAREKEKNKEQRERNHKKTFKANPLHFFLAPPGKSKQNNANNYQNIANIVMLSCSDERFVCCRSENCEYGLMP